MIKKKTNNLSKRDISKLISFKLGFSNTYIIEVINDLITSIKDQTKINGLNIKNFATFNIIKKNQRIGRNPKNKKIYNIAARKSLSFVVSKKLNDKINNI
jgi:nucleoid DNA-binding protein